MLKQIRLKKTSALLLLGVLSASFGGVSAQQSSGADSYLEASRDYIPIVDNGIDNRGNVGRVAARGETPRMDTPELDYLRDHGDSLSESQRAQIERKAKARENLARIEQEEFLRAQEEVRQLANAGAEPLPSPVIEKKRPDLVSEVVREIAPATPEELRRMIGELTERQGAALVPNFNDYVTQSSQYTVDLTLGATPPVVRVAKGIGAMVNFVDAQGNPWPIISANNFHAEASSVTQMAEHVLSVTANSPHLTGSVGVILKGLSTPVNFVVIPAQREVDYRVDLRIPQLSPDAESALMPSSHRPSLSDGNIKDFLYGGTPDGAVRLKVRGDGVQGANTRAWQNTDGRLVLRTSAMLISPSWYEREAALDGTAVYLLNSTPIVKVSVDGKESTFYIEGLKPASFESAGK